MTTTTTNQLHDPVTCPGCGTTTTNLLADRWLLLDSPADDEQTPFCDALCVARFVLHATPDRVLIDRVLGR